MNNLEIAVGRYYVDTNGAVKGPMIDWHPMSKVEHPFEMAGDDLNGLAQLYRPDGTSAYVLDLVREVSAPGFKIEAGKSYILADGRTVGPMLIDPEIISEKFFYAHDFFVARSLSGITGLLQHWDEFGNLVAPYHPQEDDFNIVREFEPEKPAETGSVQLVAKIEVNEDIIALIEATRAEIEATAGKCLEEVAKKDAELAAAKDAFNIACRDVDNLKSRLAHCNRSLGILRGNAEVYVETINALSAKLDNAEQRSSGWFRSYQMAQERKERGDARLVRDRKKLRIARGRIAHLEQQITKEKRNTRVGDVVRQAFPAFVAFNAIIAMMICIAIIP